MKIEFYKSNWEAGGIEWPLFLAKCREAGFHGVEVPVAAIPQSGEAVTISCREHGLGLIAQIHSGGGTPSEHLDSLRRLLDRAAECGAWAVNSHTGSDFFAFDDNLKLMRESTARAADLGLTLWHETHRGRALYNLPDTVRYLDAWPDLELTADISHFFAVHESLLEKQADLVARLVTAARHVHTRVGYSQGPQVPHPFAPEWGSVLERHWRFWQEIIEARRAAGAERLTILPEAGPPPYMPVVPYSNVPLADAWQVNVQMKDWLAAKLV